MLEKGITQVELSKKAGIRQAAISHMITSDRKRIEIEHLNKIIKALNIKDINEIITIEEDHN